MNVDPFSTLNQQIQEQAQQMTKRETIALKFAGILLEEGMRRDKTGNATGNEDVLINTIQASFSFADVFLETSRKTQNR
jgi:hypothetical protein